MPLETATAIVGILVVCSQMLSSLKGLYEGSSGAPALASAVQNEICEFTIILLKLQSIILESDSILSSQHGTSPLDIDQLLAGCVCTFDELREQVDSLGSIGKNDIMNRMRWAWMEKSLTKLTQRLQNHKASFTLILTILTTQSASEIFRCNEHLERQIAASMANWPHSIGPDPPPGSPDVPLDIDSSGSFALVPTLPETCEPPAQINDPTAGDGKDTQIKKFHADGSPDSREGDVNINASSGVDAAKPGSTTGDDIGSLSMVIGIPYRHDFEPALLLSRPYRTVSNSSALSLRSSQRHKSRWSFFTGGSNTSVFSLPLSRQFSSRASFADGSSSSVSATTAAHSTHNSWWYSLNRSDTSSTAKAMKTHTALCTAAASGSMEEILGLLANGANLEGTDTEGKTALSIAASHGNVNIVRLLLGRGANKEARCISGRTPLHHAASGGHDEVVEILLDQGPGTEASDNLGQTPLHEAARLGHEGTVQLLLDAGAEKEARCKSRLTPLHYAAWDGRTTTVQLLLDREADREARDKWSETPLYYAALGGHKATVELLLDRGANKEAVDEVFRVPLHYAAGGGHEPIVKLLLKRGSDKNPRDRLQRTPLHSAIILGHEGVLQLLLGQGANPHTKDLLGVSPLADARIARNKPAIELLKGLQAGRVRGDSRDTPYLNTKI